MIELLAPFSKLIDLLLKLGDIRVQRRKDIFDKFLDPVFNQLLIIHNDYIKLFNGALEQLEESNKFDRLESVYHQKVTEAKQIISKGREHYEADRYRIRAKAGAMINKSLHQEEKRFIFAVISYFLTPERRYLLDNTTVDGKILRIEEVGSDTALDSPSSSVASKIADMSDSGKIKVELLSAKSQQLERWKEVCQRYAELEAEIRVNL